MRSEPNDPLPFSLWLSELGKLADFCATASPLEEDRAVRRQFHLFRLAPPSLRALVECDLDEKTLERLLDRGQAERAAGLIAGDRVQVERVPPAEVSRYMATVSLPVDMMANGAAASPALATVRGWANLFRAAPEPEPRQPAPSR